jgi:putative MATE family efflux protein
MKNKMFTNRQLGRLILPLLVEQLLVMLVGMADTIMVSAAGEAAISGGGSVIVTQYLGNKDEENTKLSASQLLMISFVISLVFGILCVAFHSVILHALYKSIEVDVMNSASVYFWITALSFPFLGVYNSSAALYRSMNRTNTTMRVSILMNVINVVGNFICVYLLHMGAAGVAWPTLASRVVAAIVMLALCFDSEAPISVVWKDILTWNQTIISKILSIAIPNGIENGLFQLGKVIISMFVATYGTMQIAANGVTNSFCVLCYTTEMAMQLAVVTVVGQCVGANDYDQARYYIRKMLIMAMVMAVINNVILFVVSPFALQLYTLKNETLAITETILGMECLAVGLFHALAFVLPTCLRAAGDAKYTMYVGVLSMFFARVAGAYILGTVMGLGVVGTRIAMYIDWIVRIVFFAIRYKSGKWTQYRAIE